MTIYQYWLKIKYNLWLKQNLAYYWSEQLNYNFNLAVLPHVTDVHSAYDVDFNLQKVTPKSVPGGCAISLGTTFVMLNFVVYDVQSKRNVQGKRIS